MADLLWSWGVPVVIVVLVAVCYVPSLDGPFMQDDYFSHPKGRLGPSTLFWAPRQSPMAGRPIPTASMMACYALFVDAPRGYRVFNVALHTANALVLWGLLRRTLRLPSVGPRLNRLSEPVAAAVTLLWGAHPLCTESVAYITQRTELFVAFFLLSTLYSSVRAVTSAFPEFWKAAAVAFCLGGMLSKEVMVGAPLLVPLYDRAFLYSAWRDAWRERKWMYAGLFATWIPLFAIAATGPRSESTGFEHHVTLTQYLEWQALAIAKYVRLAFWPTGQSLDHGDLLHPELPAALHVKALIYGAIIVGALVGVAVVWRRKSTWAFLGAWFFLILAPTSSFVPIVTEWCAERRMYLPLTAIVAAVTVGAVELAAAWRRRRDATSTARHGIDQGHGLDNSRVTAWWPAALALVILSAATIRRAGLFSDPIALWSETVAVNPELPRPLANLAQMRYEAAKTLQATDPVGAKQALKTAQDEFAKAIALKPSDPRLHYNFGKISTLLGDDAAAESAFRKAIELQSNYVAALTEMGNLLFAKERFSESAEKYGALMTIDDRNFIWPFNYALAMKRLGRRDEAIEHFRKAAELEPRSADTWTEIAKILAEKNDIEGAEKAVGTALSIQPGHPTARELARRIEEARNRMRGQ